MANEISNSLFATPPTVALTEQSGRLATAPSVSDSSSGTGVAGAVSGTTTSAGLNQSGSTAGTSDNKSADATAKQNQANSTSDSTGDKKKQAQDLLDNLSQVASSKGWSVNLSIDKTLDTPVLTIVDASTNKVIRQIPSEEWLELDKRLQEVRQGDESGKSALGVLLDKKI